MRFTSLILLLSLSGCAVAPKPPVIPKCVTVAVVGLAPYMYCEMSDNSVEPWRVPILDANKYICTTPDGYAAGEKYGHDLSNWVTTYCKGAQ